MDKIIRGGESHWMEKTFVDEEIAVRFIRFKTKYFLIRKYKLQGVCGKDRIWAQERNGWNTCLVWEEFDSPHKRKKEESGRDKDGRKRQDYPKEHFSEGVVETYWWITLGVHEKELEGLSYEMITCLI